MVQKQRRPDRRVMKEENPTGRDQGFLRHLHSTTFVAPHNVEGCLVPSLRALRPLASV